MESFNSIKSLVEAAQVDADKAESGNKAAIQRLRAKMQEIKKLCKTVRDDAQKLKAKKEA